MRTDLNPLKRGTLGMLLFALAVAGLWLFPKVWYTRSNAQERAVWFNERTNITGWAYEAVDVGESAERVLVADQLVNGQFKRADGSQVRVFSAKRFKEDPNEIGLFVHTPDRCWTEAGWKICPAAPDVLDFDVHGVQMQFERRIFQGGGQQELVYFAGLTGGQPLPYRLDHNMSVGMRYRMGEATAGAGAKLRATDNRLWTRVWEAFVTRRPLLGPKQFVRISTPVIPGREEAADALLQEFAVEWLRPSEYRNEEGRMQSEEHTI